ncbi:MAG: hypothetical protein GY898_33590 [Proteobacteria bacterium]|nr:hypothetical protein [Pseudomonadota bacterium]
METGISGFLAFNDPDLRRDLRPALDGFDAGWPPKISASFSRAVGV